MNETLNNFSQQITSFFEKYDKKQKLKMFGIAILVIAALSILILVINQPKFVMLSNNLTPRQAAEIRDILSESSIRYKVSPDGSSVQVDAKQIADANMALGQKGIPTTGFTYEDAFNTSFSTTETARNQMHQLAFRQELANSIKTMDGISDAIVNLVIPNQDRTIFDQHRESTASVLLTTEPSFSNNQVLGIVNFLAAAVPNLKNENIKVIDQRGNILFLGDGNDYNSPGNNFDIVRQRSDVIRKDVMSALLSLGIYDDAEVVVNLVVDFDKESSVSEIYSTPNGQATGIPGSSYQYESSGVNGVAGGAPGIDGNAVPEYFMPDGSMSESNTTISQINYNVNKTIVSAEKGIGQILFDSSSIAVVVNDFVIHDEEVLERRGLLENMTFEEYKEIHSERVLFDVGDEVVNLVRNATGIPNVQVIGYEIPIFYDKVVTRTPWTNYITLGLTILIIALLAFVVYKGMEPVEITEIEPELSVEDMLATTKEHQHLDDIEFDDKSETRKQIEKFVEEKPDAVAQLLRNWLNEDWE
ncbi:flagellar M-ring protein FliF [Natranaerovirga pectinivora]|uniref:Flagellar M-ring protein FliF n=1 Tax=Natranaerovirga pectinivora TaxID=682400 RepID=A0A4R3MN51_9FIRM|nr:flagellar basal-body MS-ring/collar protein FliF [Natranaerovirga pectinivora]TCT16419.1 flagellar M-ring protein FliF [Natranaerovirga pectinivora]